MRILLTADPELQVPPPFYGGIERIVDVLVRGLKSRGHSIGLMAHKESKTDADEFFHWRGLRSQHHLDTLVNSVVLYRALRKFQPEIIHSFSRIIYMLPTLATRTPKIMSYQRAPGARSIKLGTTLSLGALSFTGCSNHISQQIIGAGGKARTIYNCVEVDRYSFTPSVRPDAPLVFLSRIERIKGAHTAIAIALQTGRRLLIAGNHSEAGENGKYWREEIVPHLGRAGIEYVGTVNDEQKNLLLGSAAAMIVPIEWEEPFGIVFVEALACGTPVITCPHGALPEIVRHGVDGFLINTIEEACVAVERIPEIDRADCRSRAVDQFSAARIVGQYEKLYMDQLPC